MALENALHSFVLLPLGFPGVGLNFLLGFEGSFYVFPLIPLTVGQVPAPSCLQEPPELLPGHQLLIGGQFLSFPLHLAVSCTEPHLQTGGFLLLFSQIPGAPSLLLMKVNWEASPELQ